MNDLCGPKVMAASSDPKKGEDNCCYRHVVGGALHRRQPTVDGRPFKLAEHRAALVEAGLTVFRPELQNEGNEGRPPPGIPKNIGGVLVYPAQHFA